MKSDERLKAIDSSQESWRANLTRIPNEDVTLMRLIRAASLGITGFTDPMLLDTGLTESSYHSLIVIVACGDKGISATAVCDQVGQTRANMTRILKLLETEKLIKIRTDPHDARRKRVVATEKAQHLIQTCGERLQPLVQTVFLKIEPKEKETLHKILRKLITSMSQAETEAQHRT